MKKFVILTLIFLIALCPVGLLTSSAAGDYVVEDGVLVSFKGLTTTVRIPADVYCIADGAFKNNTRINKLVLNDSVKIIGNEAFYGCTSLSEISGGDAVTYVGAYAFYATPFLSDNKSTSVTLGSVLIGGKASGELLLNDSIEMIAPYAFAENSEITALSSNTLSVIGEGAFYHCSKLAKVEVTDTLSYVGPLAFFSTAFINNSTEDFVVLGDGVLLEYKGSGATAAVPTGVKSVAGGAFYFNSTITQVSLPEGVTAIGQRAFMNCTSLNSVELPESLIMIDREAFAKCRALKQISLPSAVSLLGESLFYGCSSLEYAELSCPDGLPKGIFANCKSLALVKLSGGFSKVGDKAFWNCASLTDLAISDDVDYIADDAFLGADAVTVSCNGKSYAFDRCKDIGVNALKIGDADYNGKVNIRDATNIQKHAAGIITLTQAQKIRADANFDGKINVRDATYIQKMLAEMI